MSDTPRTDALDKALEGVYWAECYKQMRDCARQLERDLAAANAALAGMKQAITDPENQPSQYGTVTLAMYEASDKRAHAWAEELAAANARAEKNEKDAELWRTLRKLSHHVVLQIVALDWSEWPAAIAAKGKP